MNEEKHRRYVRKILERKRICTGPRLRYGGYPGVFEPLARVALYPTDEDGLGTWFAAA